MKQALTLSIVIPVYNEQGHIRACLDAIAAQTVLPDEVLVVDNNSTDDTVAIARQYPFVRCVTERQQGIVYARDAGFNAVHSTIIARIDADSILPRGWVAHVRRYYERPTHQHTALTGGCYFYNIRLPNFWGRVQGQIAFRMNRLLLGHYITYGSNMAMPTALWQAVRADLCRRTDIHEDLDVAIHLHRAGYRIVYQEHLRVGVKMRRVRSNRTHLMDYLMLWPQTLRAHGKKTWVWGWLGAVIIYAAWPLGPFMEWVARLCGRKPLAD